MEQGDRFKNPTLDQSNNEKTAFKKENLVVTLFNFPNFSFPNAFLHYGTFIIILYV